MSDGATRLDPHLPAEAGVRAVLATLADRIVQRADAVVAGDDADDVHQLRVAVRTSRAVLSEMKSALAASTVQPARRELAWLGRASGPARDLDVLIEAWPTFVDALGDDAASIATVRDVLAERQAIERGALVDALSSERTTTFLADWSAALADGDIGGRHGARPLGRLVARRIVTGHGRLIERGSRIHAGSLPSELHDLRKEAKVVRYVVECFGEVMDERPRRRYVKRLRALQRVLGDHQDADVHAAAVRALAADAYRLGSGPETVVALGRVVEQMLQRRAAARADFDEQFASFRSAPTTAALDLALASIGH